MSRHAPLVDHARCLPCLPPQYFHRVFMTGMRLRAAITTAIYQKSLRLSNNARKVCYGCCCAARRGLDIARSGVPHAGKSGRNAWYILY
jgi:hypothetical protein